MTSGSTKKDDRVLPLPAERRTTPLPASFVIPLPALEETEPHPPPTPVASAPRRIGGYEVERELARGGMGVVYVARSVRLERRVALKVLRSGAHAAQDEVDRFLIEARAAARLKHRGIVAVHEVDRDGDVWFLAMDLIEGESLRARVVRDGPLAPRTAAALGRDVAAALQYAHERGVLHRDVKPHNVLVDAAGDAFLTDFGLAKEVEREGITVTGDVLGTPAYMPPEQASGERARIDRRSDVYSLGATLYELVTGRPPFQGATTLNVLRAVLEDEPVPPSRLRPGLDRDLETVILTCLAKDPVRRYDTCALLAADLDRVLRDEPIHMRRPGLVERALRAGRRHRRAVLALSLALVTLAAVAVGVAITTERAQLERRRAEAREAAQARASEYRELPARSRERLRAAQEALDAARRWHTVAPDDPAATEARSRAAFELGDQARALEEWTSAREAYAEAGACGLEEARAAAAVVFCEDMFDIRRLLAVNDQSRALARLDACVARPGCYAEALLSRATLLVEQGRAADAVSDLGRVLELDPHDLRARLGRAQVLCGLGRHAEAAGDLDRALLDDPRSVTGHMLQGNVRQMLGDLPGAIASFERLVELDPAASLAWGFLGIARLQAGDKPGALRELRRGYELDRRNDWVAAQLLYLESTVGDAVAAAALAETLARTASKDEGVVVAVAQHRLVADEDLAGALAMLDDFIAQRPAAARARAQRSLIFTFQNDLERGAEDADIAMALQPRLDLALQARARVRLARGDLAGALRDATALLEVAPAGGDGYLIRAEIRESQGDLAGLLADTERACELEPLRLASHVARGHALLANGRLRAGEAVLTDVIERDPRQVEAWVGRAEARIMLGEPRAAVGDAERAHALAPSEARIDMICAEAHARAGDLIAAIADLERFLSRVPADDPRVARARELLEACRR